MKKLNIGILSLAFIMIARSVFAYDMEDGIWKNLNEKHNQTVDNKSLISGMLSNRIYYTNTFNSDLRDNEYNDTYLKTRFGANLNLTNGFSLKSVAKFEKMPNSNLAGDGKDRFFENEGAFLDELVLGYDYKNFSALAGKMAVNFGDAWKIGNGIWANEIADLSYRQSEKLGFGAIQRFGDKKKFGEYVFGASVFTNDRKNFDNSIITSRNSTSKSDGETGDTRGLNSYVLSTDIFYDFGNDEKLSYHFSYMNLAINDRQNTSNIPSKIDDQKAYAANINYALPVNKNFLLSTFAEYVNMNNIDGNDDTSSQIMTVNFTAHLYKDYFITLARAKEKFIEDGTNGIDRTINEISAGYKFDHLHSMLKGLSASIGYRQSNIDDKTNPIKSQAFGFLIAHKIEF